MQLTDGSASRWVDGVADDIQSILDAAETQGWRIE
jgi:hypothetical protein